MSQAMIRGERRREVCMELTDTSPEAGQTTASDPLCPPRGSPQSPPCVHLPPKSGTEPVSRRPRALSAPVQGPVLLEGMVIIEGGELQTVCPRLQIHSLGRQSYLQNHRRSFPARRHMPGSGGQLLGPVYYYKRLMSIETETQTLAKLTPKSERIRVHLERLASRSTNSLHRVLTNSPIGSLMEVTPGVNSYPGITDPGLHNTESSGGSGNEPLKGVRTQVGCL